MQHSFVLFQKLLALKNKLLICSLIKEKLNTFKNRLAHSIAESTSYQNTSTRIELEMISSH